VTTPAAPTAPTAPTAPIAPTAPLGAIPSWDELVKLLLPAGKLTELTWYPNDVHVRADLYRQLLMNVALGYFVYFQSDPDHPDWTPFMNSVFLLQPNPDDTYFLAHVRGSGIYRIGGERGSVRLLTYAADSQPLPVMKRVPLSEVRRYLPAATPVVSTGERDRLLRARARGAQLRRRW